MVDRDCLKPTEARKVLLLESVVGRKRFRPPHAQIAEHFLLDRPIDAKSVADPNERVGLRFVFEPRPITERDFRRLTRDRTDGLFGEQAVARGTASRRCRAGSRRTIDFAELLRVAQYEGWNACLDMCEVVHCFAPSGIIAVSVWR